MKTTQLLCTFGTRDGLDALVKQISSVYVLAFRNIYVLENTEDPNQIILTYNIDVLYKPSGTPPTSTISVHRKKATNTIYTINALNAYILQESGQSLNKSYIVDWNLLKNSIMVTAYGKLKVINTKISHILTV